MERKWFDFEVLAVEEQQQGELDRWMPVLSVGRPWGKILFARVGGRPYGAITVEGRSSEQSAAAQGPTAR